MSIVRSLPAALAFAAGAAAVTLVLVVPAAVYAPDLPGERASAADLRFAAVAFGALVAGYMVAALPGAWAGAGPLRARTAALAGATAAALTLVALMLAGAALGPAGRPAAAAVAGALATAGALARRGRAGAGLAARPGHA